MATIDWPASLYAAQIQFYLRKSGLQFRSPLNGSGQAVDFMADSWVASVTLPPVARANSGDIEAMANWLAGGVNLVRLWHQGSGGRGGLGLPRGTARGSIVLASPVVQGVRQLVVSGATAAVGEPTLGAGDMLGVGGQLFQVLTPVVLTGGSGTIETVNHPRQDIAAGSVVTWNRPTATFCMPAMTAPGTHVPRNFLPPMFDLEEVV